MDVENQKGIDRHILDMEEEIPWSQQYRVTEIQAMQALKQLDEVSCSTRTLST